MANIWVGDFRSRSLQIFNEKITKNDDIYLLEDSAEYYWFSATATRQISALLANRSSIIILLGFNDCVNSCIWESFKIDTIATNFAISINDLIEQYENAKFYVCSVNPVDAGYPTPLLDEGIIAPDVLDTKIKQFNKILKEKCKATYIDTYSCLNSTSFTTHDGIRFTDETCDSIVSYIKGFIAQIGGSSFEQRTTAPVVEAGNIDKDNFWRADTADGVVYGGLNPCNRVGSNIPNKNRPWDTLPNCTSYAWGRFYEILGSRPTLSIANAEVWFLRDGKHGWGDDGYKRGQTPAEGAVICWQKGENANNLNDDGAGHVAIVEQINPDGSIITSESGWQDSRYWYRTPRTNKNGNWGAGSDYKFQGFIYNPRVTADGVVGDYIDKAKVTSSNKSLGTSLINENFSNVSGISDEMKLNARYIWNYLGSKEEKDRWTLNAVAALLGNMQRESTINPGRWQSGREWGDPHRHGFGLVQWTPYTKYTDWCKEMVLNPNKNIYGITGSAENDYGIYDIDNALKRIEAEVDAATKGGWGDLDQWITTSAYNISFKDFTKSTREASWLGAAFLMNYERPGDQSYDKQLARGRNATFWYEYLLPYTPTMATIFALKSLTIDRLVPTEVKVSFINQGGTKYSYELYEITDNSKKKKDSKTCKITENVVSFTCKNLVPNKSYSIVIKLVGNSNTDILEETAYFETPQDYPTQIENLQLTVKDAKLPNVSLQLTADSSSIDWGYWKKPNDGGYTIQLIVNGQVKKERDEDSLPKTIKIKDYFNYDKISVDDTIQIGIRTWVLAKGKRLDSPFARCSNPVCMLAKPIIAYLNTD